jgi:hypothetical protein
MGAWGAALYSDDTTCEVRDAYVLNLKHGLSDEEAYKQILDGYGDLLSDHEVACLVYFALADTAWKYGRLHHNVQSRALALIEAGGDVFVWQRDSPSDAAARRRAIATLEARLRSVQPPIKPVKISKPRPKKITTTDPVGTVYLLSLPAGHYAAMILVGFMELSKSIVPVFSVPNWRGLQAPTQRELDLASLDTLIFSSGLGPQKHIGILPDDGRTNVMSILLRTGISLEMTLRFDSDSVVFGNAEYLRTEINAHFLHENPKPIHRGAAQ